MAQEIWILEMINLKELIEDWEAHKEGVPPRAWQYDYSMQALKEASKLLYDLRHRTDYQNEKEVNDSIDEWLDKWGDS